MWLFVVECICGRCMTVCTCVCVCVCVCDRYVLYLCVAVWCSGCVLGSAPSPRFKPHSSNFSIWFSICLLPASPVHPAVIGYLAFAKGANSRPFLMEQQWSRWDFGCPSPVPGALLAGSQFLLRCDRLAAAREFAVVCVCVYVCVCSYNQESI